MRVFLLQPAEERESSQQCIPESQLVDEDKEYGCFRNPCGVGCAVGAQSESEDKQRVEDDIEYQSRSTYIKRYLAPACRIVNSGEGGGKEYEGQSGGDDAQVFHGIDGDVLFEFVNADDGLGKDEQQCAPAEGDDEGYRDVVGRKVAGIFLTLRTDGLTYAGISRH